MILSTIYISNSVLLELHFLHFYLNSSNGSEDMIVYTNRYPYWLNGYHTMPEKQPYLALTSLGMVPERRNQNIFLLLYYLFPTWETIAF